MYYEFLDLGALHAMPYSRHEPLDDPPQGFLIETLLVLVLVVLALAALFGPGAFA